MVDEPENVVADKGYHSKAVILALTLAGWRTYVAEPRRGRQHWDGQQAERDAVYANRARKDGERGKCLMRLRGELIERTFAHTPSRPAACDAPICVTTKTSPSGCSFTSPASILAS